MVHSSSKGSNPIIRGILAYVGFITVIYYWVQACIFLNHLLPRYYLGIIIGVVTPFLIGSIFYLTGIFSLSIKKRNNNPTMEGMNDKIIGDPFGVITPITEYKGELEYILKSINEKHFSINDRLLVSLYTNGLEKVKDRFWTTTYLSSGFWTNGRIDVLNANKKMLERAGQKRNIKRIFLLRNPEEDEIKNIGAKVAEYKNEGIAGEDKIRQMLHDFDILRNTCRELDSNGCKIKYHYDVVNHIPIGINKNTEIALYDDIRVDYFGGETGEITDITIYTETHPAFKVKKAELEFYFDNLWGKATDIEILFAKMAKAYAYHCQRIDYSYLRLIKFDSGLNTKNESLKSQEMECLFHVLNNFNHYTHIHNYLDVGTCTGRYPFAINQKMIGMNNTDTYILGIDADDECINYCKLQQNIKSEIDRKDVKNIVFKKLDFIYDTISGRTFDLITCMLGTISHFGWNKTDSHEDDLDVSIKKMRGLLSPNGILVISNWSEFGLQTSLLDIYDKSDLEKIRSFTETTNRLQDRLRKYFRIIAQEHTTDKNLDLIFCKHISS